MMDNRVTLLPPDDTVEPSCTVRSKGQQLEIVVVKDDVAGIELQDIDFVLTRNDKTINGKVTGVKTYIQSVLLTSTEYGEVSNGQ